MKKAAALGLSLALTASMTLPALAVEAVPISAKVGYDTIITLNGKELDTSAIPAVEGEGLIPMRLVAENDYGSASWFPEDNTGWFYLDGGNVTVNFADNTVTVGDELVKGKAEVVNGVTFVSASVLELFEGYDVTEAEDGSITITTPNNDPLIQAGYTIRDAAGVYSMKTSLDVLVENYGVPEGALEEGVAFFPMITSPDTIILGKLAEGADVDAVKEAFEAYRKGQEDTFSWYLSQNLPKVQNARTVVDGDYILFVIAENPDAAEEAFHTFVAAQNA